ncbi:MAG: tetratricopeptide repeat protein [Breznakibacter sp.]
MNRQLLKSLAFVAVISLLASCSAQRNTRMSRSYHNLTAHYNVYFNGNESFKKGEAGTIAAAQNDYIHVLPVFEYSDPQNTSGVTADMDRAIDKGTMLISKHSITKKPKKKGDMGNPYYKAFYDQREFNKWVDDAYLLIGKSHFYKKDYDMAIRTFDHVARDFSHTPSRFEALLWKASACSEKGDYVNAKLALESYDIGGGIPPRSLYGRYMAVYADMLLKQKRYEESIPYLKGAVTGARKKDRKLRYGYILAQVYELTGRLAEAQRAYLEVIKLRPPYEMAFNAKVNRVSIVLPDKGTAPIKQEILKLLRDKRNLDYRDRIYYALASVNQAEDNVPEALKNLRLSTEHSKGNDRQKAMSFLKMGDIYYLLPQYKNAFHAYDSAMVYLPETDEDYVPMQVKHSSLQELVGYIDAKQREDSLQQLANMSVQARQTAIEGIIEAAKKRAEEARQKQAEMAGMDNDYYQIQNSQQNSTQQGGKWYFYNLSAVGMGKTEFSRKWGKRKLEDNWRRANKAAVSQNDDNAFAEPGAGFEGLPDAPGGKKGAKEAKDSTVINNALSTQDKIPTVDELMKDIPLTPGQVAKSDSIIDDALLGMALVYRDKLMDFPLAIDALNELLGRRIGISLRETALIELYRCYELNGDKEELVRVKEMLSKQFPDGKFTAFVNDPQYIEKAEALRKHQSDEYETAYYDYLGGLHASVINKASEVESLQPENPLLPKYRLLKSLAYAREAMLEPFKNSLELLIEQHPNTDEAQVAKGFLDELSKGRMPVKSVASQGIVFDKGAVSSQTVTGGTDAGKQFIIDPNMPHSVVVWIPADADAKRLRFNMADYNFSNYLVRDFELAFLTMPDKSLLLEVKGFEKQSEAMEYFYALRQNPEVFLVDNIGQPYLMGIAADNLKYVISSGDVKGYFPFFIQVYLKGSLPPGPMDEQELKDNLGNLQPAAVDLKKLEERRARETLLVEPEGYLPREGEHWYGLAYTGSGVNHVKLQNIFAGFIRNQLPNKKLTVELTDLKQPIKMLLVKGFESRSDAEAFAMLISKNAFTTNDVRSKKPSSFVIAPKNFEYLLQTGNIEEYKEFIHKK